MSFTTKMKEQFVQTMYQKTTTATTYTKNGKAQGNKAASAGRKEDEAAVYEGSVAQPAKTTYTKPLTVNQKKEEKEDDLQAKLNKTYEALSDEAKDYLAELKEKFGDIDFFVSDCATDEEMSRYFAMGTKKYSCVISSDLLERMATDEEVRAQYEEIIANADEQMEEMKAEAAEELGEEAASKIEYVGFTVDDNGVVEYFAKLKEDNDAYYAKLKEQRAEAKEVEKKAEEKRNEKKAEEKRWEDRLHGDKDDANNKEEAVAEKEDFWITADSKEGLLAAIKEVLGMEATETEETEKVELAVAETEAVAE